MNKNQTSANDDNLFEMHKKARTRRKRKFVITIAVIIVVVLVVVTVGVTLLRKKITAQVNSSASSSVESAEVTTGSISTTVSGSGTLADEDVQSLEILSTLEVSDYYVEEGDSVEEGDLIATVTNASLLNAMADKQEELDSIDEQLEEAGSDEVSDTITSSVSGRVKLINIASGDDVATVMYSDGSLMLLSLDGYMAVDVSSDSLAGGESVEVLLSDGTTVSGVVEKNVSNTATVLVSDNGTTYGDTVTVIDSDENEVGTGSLYIHSQMMITGYAGTVDSVSVSENESVSSGDTLLTLTDTETSANYDALLKERTEIEEDLNSLISIYKEGGVCAPISGVIISLDGDSESEATDTAQSADDSAASGTSSDTTIATISPNTEMSITISIDETDILSLTEGQEASVTIDSIGEDTYEGSVTEISTTASSDSGVTSYSAVITIDKTDDMLSGMSASVVITIEGVDNALLIPVDALHQTSSTAYVYTEYDESSGEFGGMQEVTIGLSNSSYVEITEGLSEGDTVYYTVSEEDSGFGDMGGFGGDMDGNFGGGMDGGSDGNSMPDGGSMPGGGMQGN